MRRSSLGASLDDVGRGETGKGEVETSQGEAKVVARELVDLAISKRLPPLQYVARELLVESRCEEELPSWPCQPWWDEPAS